MFREYMEDDICFFKQKTAYEVYQCDWSSDVCSSDLVNIALVNELKIIFDKMGIDVWEVIAAASTKPFGFMPFYPGPGLGGHCIPIDPFYLTWKAREYDVSTRFIELAGEVNVSMPDYVFRKILMSLNEAGKSLRKSRILILGMAYKKDIDDDRESTSYKIGRAHV